MKTRDYTFRQVLDESTKDELIEIKEFFNVPVAAKKRKADIVDAIMHYSNAVPRWGFKGRSADEMFAKAPY